MAIGWIKVDGMTPDKPEIMRLARLLGIDRDAAFGKLVRLWVWFDQNTVDGVVDGVVSTDVDALLQQDGFADATCKIGWLICDDDAEQVILPNFERHNGETAKKRALKARRQTKWRQSKDDDVDSCVDTQASTDASTREEKSITVSKDTGAAAPPRDETIWRIGVRLLTSSGSSESSARSLLGKYAKQDEGKLAEVIGYLAANQKIEPKAYIAKAMQPKRRSAV